MNSTLTQNGKQVSFQQCSLSVGLVVDQDVWCPLLKHVETLHKNGSTYVSETVSD